MRVIVVLPTYNELENLRLLLPALMELPVRVVVVDDHSPDGSGEFADACAAREPRISVLHRPGKLGLGTAHVAGFRRALEDGADAVMTMDADFSHHPRYIPAMIQALERADLVIGSRYVPGGAVLYPLHRRILSKTANFVARSALGLAARDCTAGFRLYRADVLRSLPLATIRASGYSWMVETLAMAARRGVRIAEVPIIFEDRKLGHSKINTSEIMRGMWTVAQLAFLRALGRQPGRAA